MKKFLAIYLGSASALSQWKATDEEQRKKREKAGMDGWMKWSKEYEKSIVDHGSPLGKTKRINAKGISDTKNEIGAYTIVQAESHEAAAYFKSSTFHDFPRRLSRGHGMSSDTGNVKITLCESLPSRAARTPLRTAASSVGG